MCYGRTLAPNITDLSFHFLFFLILSLVLTDKIPFSLMTAMLPSHQACACPLPRAVHDFHFTSVLCTSMLLHSFPTCLMLTSHLSLRQCLLYGSAFFMAVLDAYPLCMSFIKAAPSLPFCDHHAVASCLFSIPWLCLMHASNSCYLHT